MLSFLNKEYQYILTGPTPAIQTVQAGTIGYLSTNPNFYIFGTASIPTTVVGANPTWFVNLSNSTYLLESEPNVGDPVFILDQGHIITGTYDVSKQDLYITKSVFINELKASKELSTRVVKMWLGEIALILNNGWIPNWNDATQLKWFCASKYSVVYSESTTDIQYSDTVYFRTKDMSDRAINLIGELIYEIF